MNKSINHRFLSLQDSSQYSNYSFRMPLFIKHFISDKSKGFKCKVIDSLCLYALDQLKGNAIIIKEAGHDKILYNYRNEDYVIDCKIKEKSLHQISNVLKFSLKGILINQSVSVKISILCDLAIKNINNKDEVIVCL